MFGDSIRVLGLGAATQRRHRRRHPKRFGGLATTTDDRTKVAAALHFERTERDTEIESVDTGYAAIGHRLPEHSST